MDDFSDERLKELIQSAATERIEDDNAMIEDGEEDEDEEEAAKEIAQISTTTKEEEDDMEIGRRRGGGRRRRRRRKGNRGLNQEQSKRMGEANLLFVSGRFEEAGRVVLELIKEAPRAPDPFDTLSKINEQLGEHKKALQLAMIAALLDIKDPTAWKDLALRAESLKEDALAEFCLENASKKLPNDPEILYKRATLYSKAGNYLKSHEEASKLLALANGTDTHGLPISSTPTPTSASIFTLTTTPAGGAVSAKPEELENAKSYKWCAALLNAKSLFALGRKPESENVIKDAISRFEREDDAELKPIDEQKEYMGLVFNLAELLIEKEDYIGIIETIAHTKGRLKKGDKLAIELIVCHGIALIGLGKIEEAQVALGSLFNENPENYGDMYNQVGDAFMKANQLPRAVSVFEALCGTEDWNNSSTWVKLARCYRALGNFDKCIEMFEKILAENPLHLRSAVDLCEVYQTNGRNEMAVRVLDKFIIEALKQQQQQQSPIIPQRQIVMIKNMKANILFSIGKYEEFLNVAMELISDSRDGKITDFSKSLKRDDWGLKKKDKEEKRKQQQTEEEAALAEENPDLFVRRKHHRKKRVVTFDYDTAVEEGDFDDDEAFERAMERREEEDNAEIEEEEQQQQEEASNRNKKRKATSTITIEPETTAPPPPLTTLPPSALSLKDQTISMQGIVDSTTTTANQHPEIVQTQQQQQQQQQQFVRLNTFDAEETNPVISPSNMEVLENLVVQEKRRPGQKNKMAEKIPLFPLMSILGVEELFNLILHILKVLSFFARYKEAVEIGELGMNCTKLLPLKLEANGPILKLKMVLVGIYYNDGQLEKAYEEIRLYCLKENRPMLWNLLNKILTDSKMHLEIGPQKLFLRSLEKEPENFALIMLIAHHCLMSRKFQYAASEYLIALKVKPDDALATLCLGIAQIIAASNRRIPDRNSLIAKGFAALQQYARLRGENTPEVLFNIARAHQHLGINHIAERIYRKILSQPSAEIATAATATKPKTTTSQQGEEQEQDDELKIEGITNDLKMEAAYNLAQLYRNSNSIHLARQVLATYCVV